MPSLVLYLDFDGPLHPDAVFVTPAGMELRAPGTLFMHAPILQTVLEPFLAEINIVLSTQWVEVLGYEAAKARLPETLQRHVIGSTWHPGVDRYEWARLSRYEQIDRHARENDIARWLALDNDNNYWPEARYDKLVLSDNSQGLGAPALQSELRERIRERLLR